MLKNVREAILKEYNHKCAICASESPPHVHHIDENPDNNDLVNLIPLCPNCHLGDQHNPTRKIDILKLSIFRVYKDPYILKPQFEPIFSRLKFLDLLEIESIPASDCTIKAEELVDFVSFLEMGGFYSKKLGELIQKSVYVGGFDIHADNSVLDRKLDKEYIEKLKNNREEAKKLVIELLRYQDWNKK